MPWGAIAGGIAGGIGSAASAAASFAMQKQQQKWQEMMYQHRYQYQMEDMKKAGLNPILAYRQAPPGAPSGGMGSIPDMGGAITAGAERGAKVSRAQLEKDLLAQQTTTSARTAERETEQGEQHRSQALLNGAQRAILEFNAHRAQTDAFQAGLEEQYLKGPQGKAFIDAMMGRRAAGTWGAAASSARGFTGRSADKMKDALMNGPDIQYQLKPRPSWFNKKRKPAPTGDWRKYRRK